MIWCLALLLGALAERDEVQLLQLRRGNSTETVNVPAQTVALTPALRLNFYSVVPTFGTEGNWIVLLGEKNRRAYEHMWKKGNELYCSGAKRSHRVGLWQRGANFFCEWPAEEAHLKHFEVHISDARGKELAKLSASRDTGGQHETVACVRDVFFTTEEKFSAPYKVLPEWLEFNLLHGIDHFFVYTFKNADGYIDEVLTPYVAQGLATRIHFEHYPVRKGDRQQQVMEDCLYRSKNRAKWMLPSVDIDEFIRMGPAASGLFPHRTVPENYLNSAWDAIVKHAGYREGQVHSINIQLYRYDRAPPEQLEIASAWRITSNGNKFPKYVANVRNCHSLWVHYPTRMEKTSLPIWTDRSLVVANHYRFGAKQKYFEPHRKMGNTYDDALLSEVPLLESRLQKRFGENVTQLFQRLAPLHPPLPMDLVALFSEGYLEQLVSAEPSEEESP